MQPSDPIKRCLLIDAMGTLVSLAPPAPRLRTELVTRFGIELSPAQARDAIAAEIGYYRAHMDDGRDPESVRALRDRCAAALRSALPPSDALTAIDGRSMTEALLASLHFSAFDDARGALTRARARGQRVVVVSNWDVSLSDVLATVGLIDSVDLVVPSAGAGAAKPDPAIFEYALAAADVTAPDALHVGDSLEEDVGGARAAGIDAIWLHRGGAAVAPAGVVTIGSLAELDRRL